MKTNSNYFKLILSLLFLSISVIFGFGCYNTIDIDYRVTIIYLIEEGEPHTLNLHVERDTKLIGEPRTWGDKSWKPNASTGGDYGYTDIDGLRHYFSKIGGKYTFRSGLSDELWDTSMRVTKDMTLFPIYKSEVREDSDAITVTFIHKRNEVVTNEDGTKYYNTRTRNNKVTFPIGSDGTATLITGKILDYLKTKNYDDKSFELELTPDVEYGYIDYNDNGKRYSYLDSDSPILVDIYGNKYKNFDKLHDDVTLYFDYDTSCGYSPIHDRLGVVSLEQVSLDMVYIPGTTDENGNTYSWPNINADLDTEAIRDTEYYLSKGRFMADYPDTVHKIPNMLAMDTPLTQGVVKKLMQMGKGYGYTFLFDNNTQNNNGPFEKGISADDDVAWTYVNVYDAICMANLLTYLYNEEYKRINNTTFEPLSYVYYDAGNVNVFKDARTVKVGDDPKYPVTDKTQFTARENANGYRIPTSNEWLYMAKVITDERQIPDFSSSALEPFDYLVHKKGGANNYRFNFQNSCEADYYICNSESNYNVHYSGSGSGLALPYVTVSGMVRYDKTALRNGAQAMGRNATTDPREFDDNNSPKVKTDYIGNIDYSTRNGAGLYNMSGYFWQHLAKYSLSPIDAKFGLIGGYYGNDTINRPEQLRVGYVSFKSGAERDNQTTVRFVRNVN